MTNIELANEVDCGEIYLHGNLWVEFSEEQLDAFVALVEQRQLERLVGVDVEPVGYAEPGGGGLSRIRRVGWTPVYASEQVAAKVAQAAPKRLTRDQLDAALGDRDLRPLDAGYHDAIQDALGIPKEQT